VERDLMLAQCRKVLATVACGKMFFVWKYIFFLVDLIGLSVLLDLHFTPFCKGACPFSG
jgi:hypothetical protein